MVWSYSWFLEQEGKVFLFHIELLLLYKISECFFFSICLWHLSKTELNSSLKVVIQNLVTIKKKLCKFIIYYFWLWPIIISVEVWNECFFTLTNINKVKATMHGHKCPHSYIGLIQENEIQEFKRNSKLSSNIEEQSLKEKLSETEKFHLD